MPRFLMTLAMVVAASRSGSAQTISLVPCEGARPRVGVLMGVSGDKERSVDVGLDASASLEVGVKDGVGLRVDAGAFTSTVGRDYQLNQPTRFDDVRLRRVAVMVIRTHTAWCEDRARLFWGLGVGRYRYRFEDVQDSSIGRSGLRGIAGVEIATSSVVSWSAEVGLDAIRGPEDYPYTLFVASARFGVKVRF